MPFFIRPANRFVDRVAPELVEETFGLGVRIPQTPRVGESKVLGARDYPGLEAPARKTPGSQRFVYQSADQPRRRARFSLFGDDAPDAPPRF